MGLIRGLTTAEREELARLRKENRELRTERDVKRASVHRLKARAQADGGHELGASTRRGLISNCGLHANSSTVVSQTDRTNGRCGSEPVGQRPRRQSSNRAPRTTAQASSRRSTKSHAPPRVVPDRSAPCVRGQEVLRANTARSGAVRVWWVTGGSDRALETDRSAAALRAGSIWGNRREPRDGA